MLQTPNKNIYGWVYVEVGEIQLLVFLPITQVSLLCLKQMRSLDSNEQQEMSIEVGSKAKRSSSKMRKYIFKGTGNYDTGICQALSLRNGHRFVSVTGREKWTGKANL